MKNNVLLPIISIVLVLGVSGCGSADTTGSSTDFNVIETTIAEIHDAFRAGDLTSLQLVELYLERIDAYDQTTHLNSIVVVNPNARNRAEELDEEFRRTGELRPLHGGAFQGQSGVLGDMERAGLLRLL